jgi:hypothetical protein
MMLYWGQGIKGFSGLWCYNIYVSTKFHENPPTDSEVIIDYEQTKSKLAEVSYIYH